MGFVSTLLIASLAAANIFGSNGARPIAEAPAPWRDKARAVAILVPKAFLTERPDGRRDLMTDTMADNIGLCADETWARQQSLYVSCTGFLIAPDLLVTAGHCMLNSGRARRTVTPQCSDFTWLFDFTQEAAGDQPATSGLEAERFYDCAEVIEAAHDSVTDAKTGAIDFRDDFALIRLQRPVRDRAPLTWASRRPQVGDKLSMVGHPFGGSQRFSTGRVLNLEKNYDRANLDAFPGNSGSPVFNEAGEVTGLLVRGYPDSTWTPPGQLCRRLNRCDENARHCEAPADVPTAAGEHVFPAFLLGALPPSR
ncbi:MAG: trypsin-like peptidase domain-containing protein [Bdellovibrionaceae bacterium]|nr:trypsin-like peptidase domain-containing protein [Pseudobdellovibrionaceae bacterium]MBX3034672.1 trypsin-like peptidase domain-containing protein [Pseudobdellovibrionaceae bacterium]